ncbi:peroxide stress protein YaaA, partial [Hungatella sp. SL.1.14]|uniref:peroxide stress protein YaaA n=1 Tax=Hungatella sp. SL.1.14 TaxID=2963703 RepID=UPI0032E4D593
GSQWDYVKDHLRILSGFYGVLKACDGVVPWLLSQQAVADAPAHDIRLKSVLIQFFNDLLRIRRNPYFFHHAIISFLLSVYYRSRAY